MIPILIAQQKSYTIDEAVNLIANPYALSSIVAKDLNGQLFYLVNTTDVKPLGFGDIHPTYSNWRWVRCIPHADRPAFIGPFEPDGGTAWGSQKAAIESVLDAGWNVFISNRSQIIQEISQPS